MPSTMSDILAVFSWLMQEQVQLQGARCKVGGCGKEEEEEEEEPDGKSMEVRGRSSLKKCSRSVVNWTKASRQRKSSLDAGPKVQRSRYRSMVGGGV